MNHPRPAIQRAKIALFSVLTGLILSASAQAEERPTCFQIPVSDSPARTDDISEPIFEVWCYQNLKQPSGHLYIYNADQEKVKPELALIVEPDGMITHGSLKKGIITTHRTQAFQFNPFPVPIQIPKNLPQVSGPALQSHPESAEEVLKTLLADRAPYIDMSLSPGRFQAYVPTQSQPWRGYWWPYRGSPLYGSSQSPLAKYDKFVEARTGSNPGAVSWEKSHHYYKGVSWHGHCNGWAASAILRAEPLSSKTDPVSRMTFSISDIKGILAEKDYCATTSFFGRRYNGRPGDDIRDIYPTTFHKTITYYIGNLRKPVVMDYMRHEAVDNHIVSGYEMNIQKNSNNRFTVTTTLKIHKYDGSRTNFTGLAPTYRKTYRYTLHTDTTGAIIGGQWLSENPDFIWVPLSSPNCKRSNPNVVNQWTDAILAL